jgi:hypothetical protein
MSLNTETGKHRIRESQAKKIWSWLAKGIAISWWETPNATEGSPSWYTPNTPRHRRKPDPRAKDEPSSVLLSTEDFVVEVLAEIYRRPLPATARPGIRLTDEMIEAYVQDFEKAYDEKFHGQDPPNSRFEVEPNKKQPWLYDGVVYAVLKVVPLSQYIREEGAQ